MATSINWVTKKISVPKADLTFVSGTLYSHDTDAFRLELKSLEDDEEGMPYVRTHRHNTEVVISGVPYARTFEIINGYQVEYEDGAYSVQLTGSNNNVWDIQGGVLVQNQVQVIPGNSAGLIVAGSALTAAQSDSLEEIENVATYDSYQNTVWIDTASSNTGTSYPVGNRQYPVNNIADAKTIAENLDLTRLYYLSEDWTIGASNDLEGFQIIGTSHDRSVCTVQAGANIYRTRFENLALQGNGGSTFCELANGSIRSMVNFDGNIYYSELGGRIQIDLGLFRHWIRCTTNQNVGIPVLDYQGIDQDLVMTGYTGDLQVENMTSGTLEFYAESSNIVITSSCTGGTITLVGTGGLTNQSGGTTINVGNFIDSGGLSAAQHALLTQAPRKFWMGRLR